MRQLRWISSAGLRGLLVVLVSGSLIAVALFSVEGVLARDALAQEPEKKEEPKTELPKDEPPLISEPLISEPLKAGPTDSAEVEAYRKTVEKAVGKFAAQIPAAPAPAQPPAINDPALTDPAKFFETCMAKDLRSLYAEALDAQIRADELERKARGYQQQGEHYLSQYRAYEQRAAEYRRREAEAEAALKLAERRAAAKKADNAGLAAEDLDWLQKKRERDHAAMNVIHADGSARATMLLVQRMYALESWTRVQQQAERFKFQTMQRVLAMRQADQRPAPRAGSAPASRPAADLPLLPALPPPPLSFSSAAERAR
jgi:hypothetical protein